MLVFSAVLIFVANVSLAMDIDSQIKNDKVVGQVTYNPLCCPNISRGELNYRGGKWQEALNYYEAAFPSLYQELDQLDFFERLKTHGMNLTDLGKIAHANEELGKYFAAQNCYKTLIRCASPGSEIKHFPVWLEKASSFFFKQASDNFDDENQQADWDAIIDALQNIQKNSPEYMNQYLFVDLAYAFLKKKNLFHAAIYYECAHFCDFVEQKFAALGIRRQALSHAGWNNYLYALGHFNDKKMISQEAIKIVQSASIIQRYARNFVQEIEMVSPNIPLSVILIKAREQN